MLTTAFDKVASEHHPLDPPLLVVLDEAANVPPPAGPDGLAAPAARPRAAPRRRTGPVRGVLVSALRPPARLVLRRCSAARRRARGARRAGGAKPPATETAGGGAGVPAARRRAGMGPRPGRR